MEIGIRSNKTSTAKYKALEPAVSPDGRFRGGLQYAGAARTRRWSGRNFQPHNLPSRGLPGAKSVENYIRALKADMHDCLFDNLMLYGSAALRGVVIAPEGKKLVISDLSNIEGRANAWLAGEQWKLDAFAAFDRGEGPDLYNVTAGSLLGKTPDQISKTERNVWGKIPELALGYEGGVGAFQTFSRAYGVKMADQWDTIQGSLPPEFMQKAIGNFDTWGFERAKKSQTPKKEWVASETVKLAWRDRHPAIQSLWRACKGAAVLAITNPGKVYTAGPKLKFKVMTKSGHRYLLMRLPSGNFLCYFSPSLDEEGRLSYFGTDALTKQWTRLHTYGGKLVENACQSLSRDILGHGMVAAEAAGYEIVLTVHDELVTEARDTPAFNAEHLSTLLAATPPWAAGFPLAAAGFEARRYRKD
jgi:DNA polymerase